MKLDRCCDNPSVNVIVEGSLGRTIIACLNCGMSPTFPNSDDIPTICSVWNKLVKERKNQVALKNKEAILRELIEKMEKGIV